MIEIKQVKTQDEVNYTFVEKLMHTAFPQEERRDTVQQREYSDKMCIRDRPGHSDTSVL